MPQKQDRLNDIAKLIEYLPTKWFDYWIQQLDFKEEVLRFPDGRSKLTREDLRILHYVMHGVPRKVIAGQFGVTVKAIEKRLRRMKIELYHRDCECYNLQGCVRHHELAGFILAKEDWFDRDKPPFRFPER